MNSVIISLIIPVYNVELYLEQCLKSVVIHTSEAVEIIIINDASTDHSLQICKKFLKFEKYYYQKIMHLLWKIEMHYQYYISTLLNKTEK